MLIIPCGGKKVTTSEYVRARELYTGAFFKCLLSVAETLDERVFIMSAGYGLIDSNSWVKPYDKKMDKPTAKLVNSILKEHNFRELYVAHLLPKMYALALDGFNVPSLIPPVTGMGYFMQEALKLKRSTVVPALMPALDLYPQLLPNYRGSHE